MRQTTNCEHCPLGKRAGFRSFEASELSFIKKFKVGELAVEPGASVLVEGAHSAHMYTLLSGWMFRHKLLEDGRRQVLNYALAGDLVGLQGSLLGEMQHSVEAITPSRLCRRLACRKR
jgi:CRP/FNR family transcriptional regulator, anaerobic regulatory protein